METRHTTPSISSAPRASANMAKASRPMLANFSTRLKSRMSTPSKDSRPQSRLNNARRAPTHTPSSQPVARDQAKGFRFARHFRRIDTRQPKFFIPDPDAQRIHIILLRLDPEITTPTFQPAHGRLRQPRSFANATLTDPHLPPFKLQQHPDFRTVLITYNPLPYIAY